MGITQYIEELKNIEDQYKQLRHRVITAIEQTIENIGQNPAITPINKNCYTISSSQLIDTPWSPAFHNWETQAQLIIKLLKKYPVDQWGTLITNWSSKSGGFKDKAITVDKVQLNKNFLRQVVLKF